MGRNILINVVDRLRVGRQTNRGSISGGGTDISLHNRVQAASGAHRGPPPYPELCSPPT
jgi:hypothetical protein